MTESTKQCPACKEQIDVTALRCKFCTHEMYKNPATGQSSEFTAAGWISAIVFAGLAYYMYTVYQSIGG